MNPSAYDATMTEEQLGEHYNWMTKYGRIQTRHSAFNSSLYYLIFLGFVIWRMRTRRNNAHILLAIHILLRLAVWLFRCVLVCFPHLGYGSAGNKLQASWFSIYAGGLVPLILAVFCGADNHARAVGDVQCSRSLTILAVGKMTAFGLCVLALASGVLGELMQALGTQHWVQENGHDSYELSHGFCLLVLLFATALCIIALARQNEVRQDCRKHLREMRKGLQADDEERSQEFRIHEKDDGQEAPKKSCRGPSVTFSPSDATLSYAERRARAASRATVWSADSPLIESTGAASAMPSSRAVSDGMLSRMQAMSPGRAVVADLPSPPRAAARTSRECHKEARCVSIRTLVAEQVAYEEQTLPKAKPVWLLLLATVLLILRQVALLMTWNAYRKQMHELFLYTMEEQPEIFATILLLIDGVLASSASSQPRVTPYLDIERPKWGQTAHSRNLLSRGRNGNHGCACSPRSYQEDRPTTASARGKQDASCQSMPPSYGTSQSGSSGHSCGRGINAALAPSTEADTRMSARYYSSTARGVARNASSGSDKTLCEGGKGSFEELESRPLTPQAHTGTLLTPWQTPSPPQRRSNSSAFRSRATTSTSLQRSVTCDVLSSSTFRGSPTSPRRAALASKSTLPLKPLVLKAKVMTSQGSFTAGLKLTPSPYDGTGRELLSGRLYSPPRSYDRTNMF
ncbi:hypothetical protein IE81DRAFT_189665 [Ceraceosorus guamensis]|uniref:Uncharacterized protein n=1 Tax=Ceraceosorus guamensis TaxID=1522189 RepID=A0A316W8F0_9BASI|nr:hypothetical protein IE81DRAFT_189665 [Ceraceosorus guamensis]PWN45388.1 hypothetical protein IE81DRAFT_189665 [Ceraceosorus guamensis]